MRALLKIGEEQMRAASNRTAISLRRAICDEGEMLEWLKRHAWKACKLQKGFRGSNPRLSAKETRIF